MEHHLGITRYVIDLPSYPTARGWPASSAGKGPGSASCAGRVPSLMPPRHLRRRCRCGAVCPYGFHPRHCINQGEKKAPHGEINGGGSREEIKKNIFKQKPPLRKRLSCH